MKKILSLLLLASILLLTVTGCQEPQDPEAQASLPEETTEPQAEQFVKDDSYLEIVCEKISGYQNILLAFGKNESHVITASIPKGWSLQKTGSGTYTIQKNGVSIGSLTAKENAPSTAGAVGVYQKEEQFSGVDHRHVIHRYGTDAVSFRHNMTFSYQTDGTEHTLVMDVEYKELNETAANRLFYSAELKPKRTDSQTGLVKLSVPKPSIMILGNSFVAYSDIGEILSDMCNGGCTIDAVSIGYASVSETYSQDTDRLNRIRNGAADAIFLCGFYSAADAGALGPIVDACKASGTKLVIFPAHNEDPNDVASALSKFDYPILLDWKGELDDLIESGVSASDLRHNDTHGHTKPLGGYVGAHMIYRAIFGKMPPALDSYYGLSQSVINQKLGDYVTTGSFALINENLIYDMS